MFCSDMNSPLPMDIHYWEAVEAAVGIWAKIQASDEKLCPVKKQLWLKLDVL